MSEKLTPVTAHLTRSGVPVYLVNSHSHTQVVHRTWLAAPLDVGIERISARMSGCRRTGRRPSQQRCWLIAVTAQTLNISRAMRESSRKSLRAGRCSRFGRASLLDVTNAAVKDARTPASGPASAGLRRLQRHSRCGGEQHLLFGDQNRHARRRLGGVVFDCLPRSAEWLSQFGHFSPPLSGDISEPVDPAVGWEKFTAGD